MLKLKKNRENSAFLNFEVKVFMHFLPEISWDQNLWALCWSLTGMLQRRPTMEEFVDALVSELEPNFETFIMDSESWETTEAAGEDCSLVTDHLQAPLRSDIYDIFF